MEKKFCHGNVAEGQTEPAEEASEASFVHLTHCDVDGSCFEQADWVNTIVKQMWPFVSAWLAQVIKDTEPQIQKIKFLGSFKFQKIDLGTIPPLLSGVKVLDQNPTSPSDLLIDANFSYSGDADILVSVAGIEGGVTNFIISGTLQLGFKLVSKLPLINDVYVTLLEQPQLDYKLTDTLAALDFFGVDGAVLKLVNEEIAKKIVLPNKIEHKWKLPQHFAFMPQIKGVLKVEAKLHGLKKYAGKSATITLKIGSYSIESEDLLIGDDANEATFVGRLVHESHDDNTLKVLVAIKKDADDGERDKILKANVDVSQVDRMVQVESCPLATYGSVTVNLSLENLSNAKDDLKGLALLEVHLGTVKGLSRHRKPLLVKLTLGTQVKQFVSSKLTKVDRHVTFFVEGVEHQVLLVDLMDLESGKALGQTDYILHDLISRDQMTHHREAFKLQDGFKNAEMVMSLKLSAVN